MIEYKKHKLDLPCVLLLLFQPIWFYWRTVIGLRSHIPYDIQGYHFPQIAWLAQCLAKGVLPLWDPYTYAGMPMHADMQAQLFYPPTWIVMLLGTLRPYYFFYWLEWMIPVHMMLAGVTAFLLLRRMGVRAAPALLGASVFQLGGFFASQAQHLPAICCAAWLPLALRAVYESRHRFTWKWTAIFALSIGMCVLAGFAAAAIVVALAVILFALALIAMREASPGIFRPLLPGFVWGALIAAVILIPSWTLTRLSMASHRYIWLEGGGVQLEALVSLVRPNYYHIFDLEHYKLPFNATWMYVYCGIVPLGLIVVAFLTMRRKPAIFLATTALVTIFMLGINTPVYAAIFPHLPNLLRGAIYPEYALLAFSFFMGATAAVTLDHFSKRLPWLLVWALVLFTSWDLVHTGSKRPMNTGQGGPRQHDRNRDDLEDTAAVASAFRDLSQKSQPPARFDHFDFAFLAGAHAAGFQRIPTTDGDNPFMLLRYRRLRGFFTTAKFWERRIPVADPASPLLNMLSVQYISGFQTPPEATLLDAGLEKAGEVHANRIYRNPHALPRFYLTPRVRKSFDEDDTFLTLGDPAFDPAAEAIVEGIPADRDGLAVAPVHTDAWEENRIALTVTTNGPAFLATSEILYPEWTATINGKPQPLLMTNGAFRGLFLPAGTSHIEMRYRPISLLAAALISIAAVIPALWFAARRATPEPATAH